MATEKQCSERIWPTNRAGWGHAAQCSRTASVERDGKHYCKQHDPVAVKAKKQVRAAAWDAEWAEKERVERLNRAAPDMLAALRLFAELAVMHDKPENDDAQPLWDLVGCNLTLGHLRAARAAIAKATGKQEG